MGRAGVDLYPMQLETPLEDVEGFHKYVGGFAANVATGLARLGVRVAIVSAVGDDGHGRFVRRVPRVRGRRLPLAGRASDAAHRARVLRGVAARPLPDHVLPHADVPRLGARAGRARSGRDRRGAARLRQRHRPRPRAVAAGDDGRRRGARATAPGRRCSTSTGGRCCGTTRPTTPPPCGVCARMADVVLGSDEEITAAAGANEPGRILRLGPRRARAEARARRRDRARARRHERADRRPPGRGRERPRRRRRVRRGPRLAAAARRHRRAGGRSSPTGPARTSPPGSDARSRCPTKETSCERAHAARARARRHPRRGRLAMALVPVRARRRRASRSTPGRTRCAWSTSAGRSRRSPAASATAWASGASPFADLPRSLYLPPGTACTVEGEGLVGVCAARADAGHPVRPIPPERRARRGARVGQRHPPDQPHHPAGVPRPPAARGRGADARRQLVVVPAAQARAGAAAGRERPRGGLRLPVRAARGLRRAAAVQPHGRPGRDVDGARRRRAARAARLPPVLRGARLPRLLPERARRRAALDGGRGRPRPGLDAGYLAHDWSAIRASP